MSLSLDGECLKSRANKDGFYLVTAAFSTVPAYNDDKNIKGFFLLFLSNDKAKFIALG